MLWYQSKLKPFSPFDATEHQRRLNRRFSTLFLRQTRWGAWKIWWICLLRSHTCSSLWWKSYRQAYPKLAWSSRCLANKYSRRWRRQSGAQAWRNHTSSSGLAFARTFQASMWASSKFQLWSRLGAWLFWSRSKLWSGIQILHQVWTHSGGWYLCSVWQSSKQRHSYLKRSSPPYRIPQNS